MFGFEMAKLSVCLKIKISNFPHNLLNFKISAIIKDSRLKLSVLVLIVLREGKVPQISYLGTGHKLQGRGSYKIGKSRV